MFVGIVRVTWYQLYYRWIAFLKYITRRMERGIFSFTGKAGLANLIPGNQKATSIVQS